MPLGGERQTSGLRAHASAGPAGSRTRAWLRGSHDPVLVQLRSGAVRICHPTLGWLTLSLPGRGELYAGLLELAEVEDPVVVRTIEEEALAGLN